MQNAFIPARGPACAVKALLLASACPEEPSSPRFSLSAQGRCHMKHWASRECARSEAKPFAQAVRYFEPGAKITILTSRRLSQISYGKKTRLEYSDQAHTVITVTLSPGVLRWTFLKGCTMPPLAAWTSRHKERGICLKLRNYHTPLRLKNT